MANTLFNPGRAGFLAGEIDWDTASIKVGLVRGYTFSAADQFVSQVTGSGGIFAATSASLVGKTTTDGVADAGDFSFGTLPVNGSPHVLIVFQSSAVGGGADVAPAAQRLIAYIDTGTNIPVFLNGGSIDVIWDNGANRIFRL